MPRTARLRAPFRMVFTASRRPGSVTVLPRGVP